MLDPLVSIVIPAYNCEKTIRETVDSVLGQTFTDWELIIVNDASTDNIEEVVFDYNSKLGNKLVYIINDVNEGLGETRNIGIARARGKLIALLDSDDVWLPHHLETSVKSLSVNSADFYSCPVEYFDSASGNVSAVSSATDSEKANLLKTLFRRNPICPSGVVYSAKIAKMNSYQILRKVQGCEDWDMWIRLSLQNKKFVFGQSVGCRYRVGAGQMSDNNLTVARWGLHIRRKYFFRIDRIHFLRRFALLIGDGFNIFQSKKNYPIAFVFKSLSSVIALFSKLLRTPS